MSDWQQLINEIEWKRHGTLYVPKSWHGSTMKPVVNPVLPIRAAPGYSDIFGSALSFDEIVDRIRQVPRQNWLRFVALTTLICDRDGYTDSTTNQRFVRTFVHEGYSATLVALIHNEDYVLLSPQSLASLAKLAVGYAPESVKQTPDELLEFIFRTYLAVHDYVQSIVVPDANADPRSALLRFLVQNSEFATHPPILERFVRSWSLLCEQPGANTSTSSPENLFMTGTGVPLVHFLAIAFGTIAHNYGVDVDSPESVLNHALIDQQSLFRLSSMGDKDVEHFFGHLVMPDREIVRIRREDPSQPMYFYDFSAFRQTPLYRLSNNHLMPIVYPFFRWRVTDGLYWDVWFTAQNHREYGDAVKERFTREFGCYFEAYISQLFVEAIESAPGPSQSIWREPGKEAGLRNVDLVIAYPDAYVFIEIKAARLKYMESMVRGNMAEIEDDLRQMVYEPLCQLGDAIEHFKTGDLAQFGLVWRGETIFPVVITYGELVYSAILELVRESECYRRVATNGNHMPPIILDAEEGIRMASLVKNGNSIVDLLNSKFQPANRSLSFQNFALQMFGDASEPKHILDEKWERLSEIIRDTLFRSDSTGSQ